MRRNELRMYLTAKRAEKKLDKMFLDAPLLPWGTTADHAIDRVRTNGLEDLSTLIDLVQEGEEYMREATEHERLTAECKVVVQKVLDELDGYFELCPKCQGTKGAKDYDNVPMSRVYVWRDCGTCAGRGMVPRGESRWQDEGRTYTPAERVLSVRLDCWPVRREAA